MGVYSLLQLPVTLLTASVSTTTDGTTNISGEVVTGFSKTIAEFGIMVVCCAVLLIFAIVMFRVFIKRFDENDRELAKTMQQSLETITKLLETNVNIAEIFDKHNTKSTFGFEYVKNDFKTTQDAIAELKEQNEKMQKMLDKQTNLLNQINQTVSQISSDNKSNGNKNTLSR